MDHGFQFTCLQESKRFIWLLGIIFAVLMVVQHFELPYGSDLSSLLSSKVPFIRKSYSSAGELSSDSEMSGKSTLSDGLNSTYTHAVHETSSDTEASTLMKETNYENAGKDGENSTLKGDKSSVSSGTPEKAKDTEHNISSKEVTESNGSSFGIIQTRPLQGNLTRSNASSSLTDLPAVNKTSNMSTMPVMPISKMIEILQQSRSSPHSLVCI